MTNWHGATRGGRIVAYTEEELLEARRQIGSTIRKLRNSAATMETKPNADKLKPQITLARRRIRAFEIADELIERELTASRATVPPTND